MAEVNHQKETLKHSCFNDRSGSESFANQAWLSLVLSFPDTVYQVRYGTGYYT